MHDWREPVDEMRYTLVNYICQGAAVIHHQLNVGLLKIYHLMQISLLITGTANTNILGRYSLQ